MIVHSKEKTKRNIVFNGIICLHDYPVESYIFSHNIVFLHNKKKPLPLVVKDFLSDNVSLDKIVSLELHISDTQMTENELLEDLLQSYEGELESSVKSTGHPYSDVTPDICWTHYNEFKVGGHDINRLLTGYTGKWLWLKVTSYET